MCLVKRSTSPFPASQGSDGSPGRALLIPDDDDCVAALPVQLKSDNGKAMRKQGLIASWRQHTHSGRSPMKTVRRNNLSEVLDRNTSEAATDGWKDIPLMNEEEKGNVMARWSESQQRRDRGDIAAKNGGI